MIIEIDMKECQDWRSRASRWPSDQSNVPAAEMFVVHGTNAEGLVVRTLLTGSFDWPYYLTAYGKKWRFACHLESGLAQYHPQ
jgi:hypothetical protein